MRRALTNYVRSGARLLIHRARTGLDTITLRAWIRVAEAHADLGDRLDDHIIALIVRQTGYEPPGALRLAINDNRLMDMQVMTLRGNEPGAYVDFPGVKSLSFATVESEPEENHA